MFIQTHSLTQYLYVLHTNTVKHTNIMSYLSSLEVMEISLQASAAWFNRLLPHKCLYECRSGLKSVQVASEYRIVVQ